MWEDVGRGGRGGHSPRKGEKSSRIDRGGVDGGQPEIDTGWRLSEMNRREIMK